MPQKAPQSLWRLTCAELTMFVTARDFQEAKEELLALFLDLFERQGGEVMLGELIFIERIKEGGSGDPASSGLEFTETWLKTLGIDFEIVGQA